MNNYLNLDCSSTIATDAYKITHWLQRPVNMTYFYNYLEARKGGQHKEFMFAGLQPILMMYFTRKINQSDIDEGFYLCHNVFGVTNYFPKEIWEKVKNIGYFPVKIMAAKEGTVMPVGNVCLTCESTEPWFAPMISHFEDYLMHVWYTCGVATRTFNIKLGIYPSFLKSSDNMFLGYVVNDFGLRGGMGMEAATLGGMMHLINFDGTDNLPAVYNLNKFYGGKVGGSVWATEHSVATVWGPGRGEFDYIKAQLERSAPESTISIVIDSYDSTNFIKNVVGSEEIKQLIINKPGRVVLRPDSGDPLANVCKYSEMLGNIFGYHLNSKDYKVLNHNVGIIQGDGMTEKSIPELYSEYIKTGWSAENIITGSGGGLLVEGLTRDTDRWAIKASYAEIDDKPIDVSKAPQTDLTKSSKPGKLKLHKSGKNFSTISSVKESAGAFAAYINVLDVVLENGELKRYQTIDEIRGIGDEYFQERIKLL